MINLSLAFDPNAEPNKAQVENLLRRTWRRYAETDTSSLVRFRSFRSSGNPFAKTVARRPSSNAKLAPGRLPGLDALRGWVVEGRINRRSIVESAASPSHG